MKKNLSIISIQNGKMLLCIGIFFFMNSIFSFAQCSNVDQSQLNYNGGTSARNLSQYTVWQSFTSGVTGTFCKLYVGFFNAMTGTGTLNIFAGIGTAGALLQTQTVTVSGTSNFFQSFSVSVPVTSGSVYTFQFIPAQGGGLPDPYGVQIENPGTYSGGQMELTDPSGTYITGFDMVFKTYVTLSTGVSISLVNETSLKIIPNPFVNETVIQSPFNLTNATLSIYNVLGQEVKTILHITGQEVIVTRENLREGIYLIMLTENNKTITIDKFVINK